MDKDIMLEYLNNTLHHRIGVYCCALLLVIVLIFKFVIPFPRRTEKEKEHARNKRAPVLAIVILIVICLVAMLPSHIISVYHDIENVQIIESQGYYRLDATSIPRHRSITSGYVYVTIEGISLTLGLPTDWNYDDFPEGSYYGTIWYSQESKIVLQFVPNAN